MIDSPIEPHGIGEEKFSKERSGLWTSLVVQWVRFHAPIAGGLGSIPGQGTRSHMHATTTSSNAATKRSCVPQLRPGAAGRKEGERQGGREGERKGGRKKITV